jgi:hypothetical protein
MSSRPRKHCCPPHWIMRRADSPFSRASNERNAPPAVADSATPPPTRQQFADGLGLHFTITTSRSRPASYRACSCWTSTAARARLRSPNLEQQFGELPPTLTSVTASGCHLWFRIEQPLPSSTGRIGPGLDTRADGGYVLAPPSLHPDGPVYRWSNSRPLAIVPEWLAARAQRSTTTMTAPSVVPSASTWTRSPGAYGRAVLDRECEAVATAPCGTRNDTLNRASFALHQLVAGGELDQGEVHHRLLDAASACGLVDDPHDEPHSVERTIASGARAGLRCPRRRPTT